MNKDLTPQTGDTVITKKPDGSMVFGTYVLEIRIFYTIQNKVEKYDCKPNDTVRVVMSIIKPLIPKSEIKTRSRKIRSCEPELSGEKTIYKSKNNKCGGCC